jgi:hypothetical protein
LVLSIVLIIAAIAFGVALWRFKFKAHFLPTVALAIMITGIGALCQPWIRLLYRYGLAILITGLFSYIVTSHFE